MFRSNQSRLRDSVTEPSWTMRLFERSSGSASPRFSQHSRSSAPSSSPRITRASDPPMKPRLEESNNLPCAFAIFGLLSTSST